MKKSTLGISIGAVLIISVFLTGVFFSKKKSIIDDTQVGRQVSKIQPVEQPVKEEKRNIDAVSILQFDKKELIVSKDEKFSLQAMADPKGKKINAAELHITFDSKILKLENIVPSDVFSLVFSNADINNEKGVAAIILAIPLDKPSRDKTSPIATFNFQALSQGGSYISFSDKSLIAAEATSNNVVGTEIPTKINVK
jgi:hypothetical protein